MELERQQQLDGEPAHPSSPYPRVRASVVARALAAGALAVHGLATAQSGDPFNVTSDSRNAIAGPLTMVTLVVGDSGEAKRFFGDALQMTLMHDAAPSEADASTLRAVWGLPQDASWHELRFGRGLEDAVDVRVLVMPDSVPVVRPAMNALLPGGLSIGLPVADAAAFERSSARLGFRTTAGIRTLHMPRGDGSTYRVEETHYPAPEGVFALGVWREAPLVPVGPIAPGAAIGGPAYSGMVVGDSDKEIDFFQQLLGWEVRRDVELTTGEVSGLSLPQGTGYRFLQLFAPGATTGYLVMLDFRAAGLPSAAPPRIPSRGLVAWSFRTQRMDELVTRIGNYGGTGSLLHAPVAVRQPDGSVRRVLTLLTPNGLLLEVSE